METVVVRITARSGMEDKVEAFYLNQQAEYEAASGFLGRTILKARTGAMLKSIQSRMSAEQMAKHPTPEVDEEPGTEFVLIERWESVESRLNFTMSRSRERDKDLFPYLLPQHSSEYFEDVTG